jgi:hypothetical protein
LGRAYYYYYYTSAFYHYDLGAYNDNRCPYDYSSCCA